MSLPAIRAPLNAAGPTSNVTQVDFLSAGSPRSGEGVWVGSARTERALTVVYLQVVFLRRNSDRPPKPLITAM